MQSLLHQRCFNHAVREAVARCPECGHCFCRECVTEHDDRFVCTSCLKKLARTPLARRPAMVRFFRFGQCTAAVFIVWFLFFLMGTVLLKIPTSFHEGTLWHVNALDRK